MYDLKPLNHWYYAENEKESPLKNGGRKRGGIIIRLDNAKSVRLYLKRLLTRVEKGEIDRRTGETLSNIAYKILICIQTEVKEEQIKQVRELTEQLSRIEKGEMI